MPARLGRSGGPATIGQEPIIDLPDSRGACVVIRDAAGLPGLLWADPSALDGTPYFISFDADGIDAQLDGMPSSDPERAVYERMQIALRNSLARYEDFTALPSLQRAQQGLGDHLAAIAAARADAGEHFEIAQITGRHSNSISGLVAVVAVDLDSAGATVETLSEAQIGDRLEEIGPDHADYPALKAAGEALQHLELMVMSGAGHEDLPSPALATARLTQKLASEALPAADQPSTGLRVVAENPRAAETDRTKQNGRPGHLTLVR